MALLGGGRRALEKITTAARPTPEVSLGRPPPEAAGRPPTAGRASPSQGEGGRGSTLRATARQGVLGAKPPRAATASLLRTVTRLPKGEVDSAPSRAARASVSGTEGDCPATRLS